VARAFSYVVITIFFFSTTGLGQLFKLPVLVMHYMEHRERDNSIGMIEFLSMHYWGQDINDNDDDRDMQLPFRNVDQNAATLVILMPQYSLSISRPLVADNIDQPVFSDPDHSDPAFASLFRPPRA
jgi:hypothetical protein